MPVQIPMILSSQTTSSYSTQQNLSMMQPANTFIMGNTGNNRVRMNMFAVNNKKGGCRTCGGR